MSSRVPGAPSFALLRRVGHHKCPPRSCLCFSVCHSRQGIFFSPIRAPRETRKEQGHSCP